MTTALILIGGWVATVVILFGATMVIGEIRRGWVAFVVGCLVCLALGGGYAAYAMQFAPTK